MGKFQRATQAALIAVCTVAIAGCGEGDATIADVLAGTWKLTLLSGGKPNAKPNTMTLVIEQKQGWFGSSLIANCGRAGLLPFTDMRELEVEIDRSPRKAPTGTLYANCLRSLYPGSGFYIDALFDGRGRMAGRLTFQRNHGNKAIGPAWVVSAVVLFHGVRQRGPAS